MPRTALSLLAAAAAALAVAPAAPAAVGDLTFLDCLGGNGQDYAPECEDAELSDTVNNFTDVALSPDGSRLYAVSLRNNSITWFDRDAATGLLTWVDCITSTPTDEDPPPECSLNIGGDGDINSGEDREAALDRADSIVVNDDLVIVGGENGGISWFTPTATGLDFGGCLSTYTAPLDQEDCETVGDAYDGVFGTLEDMALTPDGEHLVVVGDSEDAFAFLELDADGVGGVVSCRQATVDMCAGTSAAGEEVLEDAVGVEVGADALFVLGWRWSAVGSFARSGAETTTSPVTCFSFAEAPRDCSAFPHGAFGMVEEDKAILLDPQGDDLYIASQDVEGNAASSTASIVHFDVAAGGALTFADCVAPNVAGCEAPPAGAQLPLDVWRLTLSVDGRHLYASDDDDEGVAILAIDPASGDMAWQGCVTSDDDVTTPCARVPDFSLSSPSGMVVSPDDRFLYVAHSEGITTLARERAAVDDDGEDGEDGEDGDDLGPPPPPGDSTVLPPPLPPPFTPPSTTPAPRPVPVIRGPRRVRVRNNTAPVEVECAGVARCDGRVYMTFAAARARAAAAVTIGSARFSIPAGAKKKVRVKLNVRGRQLLRKRKRLRVRVVVKVRGAAAVRRTITLRR